MRPINFRALPFAAALLFVPTLTLTACAKTTKSMHSSASVPASEGTVKATEGDDGNTDVTIQVKHLALPSLVESDATLYIVWFQAPGGNIQNMGAMTVDDELDGRFDGSSPHRRFWVSVTPEPNRDVAMPTHQAVFTSEVDRD